MWVQRIVRRWRNGSKRNRISYRGLVGGILPAILLVIFLLSAISDSSENRCREENEKNDTKGYDLPVDEREREEAWDDCIRMMHQYLPGGNGSGMSYSKEDMRKMQKKAARAGFPVTTSIPYSNMENYESAEQFLLDCMDGKKGNIVIYEIDPDGGIVRNKYVFAGSDQGQRKCGWNHDINSRCSV